MTDMHEELDDFAMPGDAEREAYTLADVPHANRLVRRLRRLTGQLAQVRAEADQERRRVDRWEGDRSAGAEEDIRWLEGTLKSYMRELIRVDPTGPKTLPLLGAKVRATQTGGLKSVVVRDRDEYLPWAIEHEAFDRASKVAVPWETLMWAERYLSGAEPVDGPQKEQHRAQVAAEILRAMDDQVKLTIPKGVQPEDEGFLRSGQECGAADPETGEVLPGVVITPIGYNLSVTLEDE